MKIEAGGWRGLWRRLGWHLGGLWLHFEALEAATGKKNLKFAECAGPLLPRRGAADPPQGPRAFRQADPQICSAHPILTSKIASKFSLDF